jgi:hypothetical protein
MIENTNIKTNAAVEEFKEVYLGKVEDIMDPLYEGRCRVRVFSLFDDIEVADLPWAIPANKPLFFGQDARAGSLSIPKVGAVVQVRFNNGDIYSPEYCQVQEVGEDIKDELKKGAQTPTKYEGAHFILFDGDEEIKFWFDREIGLQMEMKKSFIRIDQKTSNVLIEHKDNQSSISLENNVIRIVSDSQINLTTGSQVTVDARTIKITGGNVEIGKDGVFNNAVLGNQLEVVLNALAAAIDAKMPATPGATLATVQNAASLYLAKHVTIASD